MPGAVFFDAGAEAPRTTKVACRPAGAGMGAVRRGPSAADCEPALNVNMREIARVKAMCPARAARRSKVYRSGMYLIIVFMITIFPRAYATLTAQSAVGSCRVFWSCLTER